MVDTLNLILWLHDAGNVDFLSETPCYLENVGEHFNKGMFSISGDLIGAGGRLRINLNQNRVKIGGGSLCKWYLGDNFKTMERSDVEMAVEMLSDTLHLPISKASVTRLDIGRNIITECPPDVYFNHLGQLGRAQRLVEPNGLYYVISKYYRLNFYDKCKEAKEHRQPLPEMYEGRNVMRYEERFLGRVAAQLKVGSVTGASLYNEAVYISLQKHWKDSYKRISKINDIKLNFNEMKTKKQLYQMAVLCMIEQQGGQIQFLEQINEKRARGDLSDKQAYDLREAVKKAYKTSEGMTAPSDVIEELDRKVSEAVRFYR